MHGAVIVKNNRVLSTGINKFRNHPDIIESEKIDQFCSVHAEIDALSRVANASGATIFVARVNRAGIERMSRPCNNCYTALLKAGIDTVIYTKGKE